MKCGETEKCSGNFSFSPNEGINVHPLLLISEKSQIEVVQQTYNMWMESKLKEKPSYTFKTLNWTVQTFMFVLRFSSEYSQLKENVLKELLYILKIANQQKIENCLFLTENMLEVISSFVTSSQTTNFHEIFDNIYQIIFEYKYFLSEKSWKLIIKLVLYVLEYFKPKEYSFEFSQILAFMFPLSQLTDIDQNQFLKILEVYPAHKHFYDRVTTMVRSILEYTFQNIFDFTVQTTIPLEKHDDKILADIKPEILLKYAKLIIQHTSSKQDTIILTISIEVIQYINKCLNNNFKLKFPLDQFLMLFAKTTFTQSTNNFNQILDLIIEGYLIDKNWRFPIIMYLKYLIDNLDTIELNFILRKIIDNFVANERIFAFLVPYILRHIKDNPLCSMSFLLTLAIDRDWITEKIIKDSASLSQKFKVQSPFQNEQSIPSFITMINYIISKTMQIDVYTSCLSYLYYTIGDYHKCFEIILSSLNQTIINMRNGEETIETVINLFLFTDNPLFYTNPIVCTYLLQLVNTANGETNTKILNVVLMILVEISNRIDLFSIDEKFRQAIFKICYHHILTNSQSSPVCRQLIFNALIDKKKVFNAANEIQDLPDDIIMYKVNEYLFAFNEGPKFITSTVYSPYGFFKFTATPVPFITGENADDSTSEENESSVSETSFLKTNIPPNQFTVKAMDFLYNIGILNAENSNNVQYYGRDINKLKDYHKAMMPLKINISVRSVDENSSNLEPKKEFSSRYKFFLNLIGDRTERDIIRVSDFMLFTAYFIPHPLVAEKPDMEIIFVDGESFINPAVCSSTIPRIIIHQLHKGIQKTVNGVVKKKCGAFAVYLKNASYAFLSEEPVVILADNINSLVNSFVLSNVIKQKYCEIMQDLETRNIYANIKGSPQDQLVEIISLSAKAPTT